MAASGRSRLARPARFLGDSHIGNWSTSTEPPTGTQDSGAFDEPVELVGPMIERCRAGDEIEGRGARPE
jgi:hypothetical protein